MLTFVFFIIFNKICLNDIILAKDEDLITSECLKANEIESEEQLTQFEAEDNIKFYCFIGCTWKKENILDENNKLNWDGIVKDLEEVFEDEERWLNIYKDANKLCFDQLEKKSFENECDLAKEFINCEDQYLIENSKSHSIHRECLDRMGIKNDGALHLQREQESSEFFCYKACMFEKHEYLLEDKFDFDKIAHELLLMTEQNQYLLNVSLLIWNECMQSLNNFDDKCELIKELLHCRDSKFNELGHVNLNSCLSKYNLSLEEVENGKNEENYCFNACVFEQEGLIENNKIKTEMAAEFLTRFYLEEAYFLSNIKAIEKCGEKLNSIEFENYCQIQKELEECTMEMNLDLSLWIDRNELDEKREERLEFEENPEN